MPITPQVPLTAGNIETILNTLVYDGRAESSVVLGGGKREGEGGGGGGGGGEGEGEGVSTVYRLSRLLVSDAGISRVPCGVCPVSG